MKPLTAPSGGARPRMSTRFAITGAAFAGLR